MIFKDFLGNWNSDMTTLTTSDTKQMIDLDFVHSIMYVTMRNSIQCKGHMAVIGDQRVDELLLDM